MTTVTKDRYPWAGTWRAAALFFGIGEALIAGDIGIVRAAYGAPLKIQILTVYWFGLGLWILACVLPPIVYFGWFRRRWAWVGLLVAFVVPTLSLSVGHLLEDAYVENLEVPHAPAQAWGDNLRNLTGFPVVREEKGESRTLFRFQKGDPGRRAKLLAAIGQLQDDKVPRP